MKTIDDVVREYPDGWPSDEYNYCFTTSDDWTGADKYIGAFEFANLNGRYNSGELCISRTAWTIMCSRAEYEQYLAAKSNQWYDYDKQQQITAPPVGTECEVNHGGWNITTIVAHHNDNVVYDCNAFDADLFYDSYTTATTLFFRPLDYNKNTPKIVDMRWIVDSGIDCEFSDDAYSYKHCRPRMNHKMVVSWKQYQHIPRDVFEMITHSHSCTGDNDNIIVEFTGLKDGWKFSYE